MTTNKIHSTAIVEPGAKIGVGVEISAYAVIGADVELGDKCRVAHHASITGPAKIGPENEFYPFTAIGGKTQDLKYEGEPTTAMRKSGPMRTAIISFATCSPLRTPASYRCATISVRP